MRSPIRQAAQALALGEEAKPTTHRLRVVEISDEGQPEPPQRPQIPGDPHRAWLLHCQRP